MANGEKAELVWKVSSDSEFTCEMKEHAENRLV